MGLRINYVLQRATDTHACMVVIRDDVGAPWEWSEMTAVAFKAKLDAANALVGTESGEAVDTLQARALRDVELAALMVKAQSYLGLAKRKYRNDEAKMRILRPLKTSNTGVRKKLQLLLDVKSAWEQIDSTYVPETGNTFAAFGTAYTSVQAKFSNLSKEGAEENQAEGQLSKGIKELYRLSVDWYQEAIRRFGAETPHGMMIREQIDTGATIPIPGKAVITSIVYENNGATITFDAPDATHFDVFVKFQAEGDFTKVGDNITAKTFTVGDTHADFHFKVVGKNSRDDGPESDEATISG